MFKTTNHKLWNCYAETYNEQWRKHKKMSCESKPATEKADGNEYA